MVALFLLINQESFSYRKLKKKKKFKTCFIYENIKEIIYLSPDIVLKQKSDESRFYMLRKSKITT